jgi:tetratricopeptide (TPR) repeat protein
MACGCSAGPQASARQKLSEALAQRQERQAQAQQLHEEGLKLLSQQKLAPAAQKFRAAVEADERHAGAWVALGVAAYRQEDWAAAATAFDRARSLAPHRPEPHYNLGMTLEALGQYSRAIESYERALKLNPDHLEATENLVRCLVISRTKPARALELTRKALTVETRAEWRDWLNLQAVLLSRPDQKVVMTGEPKNSDSK